MESKVFTEVLSFELEESLNTWLRENKNIKIVAMQQSIVQPSERYEGRGAIILTVIYKNQPSRTKKKEA